MDGVVAAADPYQTDVGRLRMDRSFQAGARLMAGRDPVEVTVEAGGREVTAGTLWIHDRGGQSATFGYASSYLADPGSYALDPALPRAAGAFHTSPGSALFGPLSPIAARGLIADIERATSSWRDVSRQLGLPAMEIERMTAAYETEQRLIARAMAPA